MNRPSWYSADRHDPRDEDEAEELTPEQRKAREESELDAALNRIDAARG